MRYFFKHESLKLESSLDDFISNFKMKNYQHSINDINITIFFNLTNTALQKQFYRNLNLKISENFIFLNPGNLLR